MKAFVQAAAELRRFGWLWCSLGAFAIAAAVPAGLASFEAVEVAAAVVVVSLSLFGAFAGLLLARRTGPAILYKRIFDRAPETSKPIPREEDRRSRARIGLAASYSTLLFVLAGLPAFTIAVGVIGGGRPEEIDRIPAGALVVGGAWTLAAGLTALRIAHYFARWERARGKIVLCLPRRAGLLQQVYVVVEAPEPPAGA